MQRTGSLQAGLAQAVRHHERREDGSWLAQLKSPPVDGKANAELIALLAREFGCAKSAVEIATGAGARVKRVRIAS